MAPLNNHFDFKELFNEEFNISEEIVDYCRAMNDVESSTSVPTMVQTSMEHPQHMINIGASMEEPINGASMEHMINIGASMEHMINIGASMEEPINGASLLEHMINGSSSMENRQPMEQMIINEASMERKVVVVKIMAMTDASSKQKAMEAVADIYGIDSITANLKEQKMTIVGNVEVVAIANKLKKIGKMRILSVGPAEEEDEKKEDLPVAPTTSLEINEQKLIQYYGQHQPSDQSTGLVVAMETGEYLHPTLPTTTAPTNSPPNNTGQWTREEHNAFLEGRGKIGRKWTMISKLYVPTRTRAQVASHNQKYEMELAGTFKKRGRKPKNNQLRRS